MPVHIHNTALIYYIDSQPLDLFCWAYLQKNLYIIELLAEFHPQSFYFRGLFITSHVLVSQLREKKGSGSQTGVKVPALIIINQHHHIIGIQFKVEIKKIDKYGIERIKNLN